MKRSTFNCPPDVAHFIEILNESKAKLLIFDLEKSVMWSSNEKTALQGFEFPDEGKVFFAENESQAKKVFETVSSETDNVFVTVVRSK